MTAIDETSTSMTHLDRARALMSCRPEPLARTSLANLNGQWANDWLDWLGRTAGRTPQTVYNYASLVARYLDECVGDTPLGAVPVERIDAWLLRPRAGRARGQVAAPATRARNVAVLRSFYGWLMARGLVQVNVAAQLAVPKVRNRNPRPLPDGAWATAWACAEDVRLRGCLALGFLLGFRRNEMVTLGAEHVDAERRMLTGFVRKGGGDDTMPVDAVLGVWEAKMPTLLGGWTAEDAWGFLEGLAAKPLGSDGTLLGLRNPDHVNKLVRAHLERLGTPGAWTPHALRHSFVTNLLRCGMPIEMVSELANHSSLDVTMRYAKIGGARVTEWVNQSLAAPTVNVSDWTA